MGVRAVPLLQMPIVRDPAAFTPPAFAEQCRATLERATGKPVEAAGGRNLAQWIDLKGRQLARRERRQQALLVSGCAWDALLEELGPETLACIRCERSFVGIECAEFDAAVELAEHETTGERCTHFPRCDERGHSTEQARLQLRCPICDAVTEFTTD